MAVKYQKMRFLIAGSLAAAVIGGTAYFAQPITQAPVAAEANAATTSTGVGAAPQAASAPAAAASAQTTNRTTTTKAKKTRGS